MNSKHYLAFTLLLTSKKCQMVLKRNLSSSSGRIFFPFNHCGLINILQNCSHWSNLIKVCVLNKISILKIKHCWKSLLNTYYDTGHSMCGQSLSRVQLFATPRAIASQASPSIEIFQARTQEQLTISYSRGFSRPRNWTGNSCVSYIGRQLLYHSATWEALQHITLSHLILTTNLQRRGINLITFPLWRELYD